MYWNIGIAIFGVVVAVVAIIILLVFGNEKNEKRLKQICKLFAVVGAALCLFGLSFKIVPTGYTGAPHPNMKMVADIALDCYKNYVLGGLTFEV